MIVKLLGFIVIVACSAVLSAVVKDTKSCRQDEHLCSDGSCVSGELVCDNRADCADASDERHCHTGPLTLQINIEVKFINSSNSQFTCRKNQWQCHDGTCIPLNGKCDDVVDCPDSSDEVQSLCQPQLSFAVVPQIIEPSVLPASVKFPSIPVKPQLPPEPPRLSPNQPEPMQPGHCKLKQDSSVEYRCVGSSGTTRDCGNHEPSNTVVQPVCSSFFYFTSPLPLMRCTDGSWDYIAKCIPECGRLPSSGSQAGRAVPWHAVIYTKDTLQRICAGTIISESVVITAASCFMDDKMRLAPASNYVVAVGKLYQQWDSPLDEAQTSDVKTLQLPLRFRGSAANYQDDIAIVGVAKAFTYNTFVGPICLDFDINFERSQWNKTGKIAGWYKNSTLLQVRELPHIDIGACIANSPQTFIQYITSDKICVGNQPNTLLCKGDLGVGLALPNTERNVERHYLRGVASYWTGDGDDDCNTKDEYSLFTQILKHKSFIESQIQELQHVFEDNSSVVPPSATHSKPKPNKCLLPPFPEHGSYVTNLTPVDNVNDEGTSYELVTLTTTCKSGYGVQGPSSVQCFNGYWPEKFPQCIQMCPLKSHRSVEYRCVVPTAAVGWRKCRDHEPPGTVVIPRCREPLYYSTSPLPFMRCQHDARWNYIATCKPDCGRATPHGSELVFGGVNAKRGDLPWHAAIYDKSTRPYMQICGGSLISNDLIISAAHCFWSGKEALPESLFAVAVGKLYRPWNDKMDDAQKSDVKRIHLPPRFRGSDASFQDDIAVVVVTEPFEYRSFIRPVCLSFATNFERRQLQPINKGKVAGWGLTSANGKASPVLQVVELPYVDVDTCIAKSPPDFKQFITGDKICAGSRKPNSALCRGDSGGGLVFLATDELAERYYLRGVVSTAPSSDQLCNIATYTTFTQILPHEDFIVPYLTEF